MKIILATPLFPPELGEPAPYSKTLAAKLSSSHEVAVVTYANSPETIDDARVVSVQKYLPLPVRLTLFSYRTFREVKKGDLVYAQGVAAGLPAFFASKLRSAKFVYRVINDEAWARATRLGTTTLNVEEFLSQEKIPGGISAIMLIQKWIMKLSDRVTVPSEYYRGILKKIYKIDPEKIRVVYPPVETPDILPWRDGVIPAQICLFADPLSSPNIKGIISALPKIIREIPDIHIIIAGETKDEHELRNLAKKLEVESHLTWKGHVSKAEHWHLHYTSMMLLITATSKDTPQHALNAMATETIVIAPNTPSINEVIIHEGTGILVDPDRPESFAEAIISLHKNQDLKNGILSRAKSCAEEKHGWRAHVSELKKIFADVENT